MARKPTEWDPAGGVNPIPLGFGEFRHDPRRASPPDSTSAQLSIRPLQPQITRFNLQAVYGGFQGGLQNGFRGALELRRGFHAAGGFHGVDTR